MGDTSVEDNVLERILARTEEPRHLPLQVLERITEGFSEDRKIGAGGFGVVYKGYVQNWTVAVKRIAVNINTVDDTLFDREVESLLKVSDHPNVVRFLGFCSNTYKEAMTAASGKTTLVDMIERLLCFEYISNRSLDKHITDELRGLEWNIRYDIIKGICEGLQYLHKMRIIHMDLKPANIMVDDYMKPKITDFGLARSDTNSRTTGKRFISRGYSAPEYYWDGTTTMECDIYSLGATINELVTGRKGITDKNNVLRRWRHRWKSSGNTQLLAQQVTECIEIAERCMQIKPSERPSLANIIDSLDKIGNTNTHISAVGQINPSWWDDDDMLGIEPLELHFAFELNKEISNEVVLTNDTDNCIAFNIKTECCQLQYCTLPNKGIMKPKSKSIVKITLQAKDKILGYIPRADKFIVQSTKVEEGGLTDEEITEVFNNEVGKVVDEVNLTVVYDDKSEKPEADQSLEPNARLNEAVTYSSYEDVRLNFNPIETISATMVSCQYKPTNRAAIDLMTGAMGSLLLKLRKLLMDEHNLLEDVEEDVESLVEQLMDLHSALCNVPHDEMHKLDLQDKRWANKVRDLSYDIEDEVDGLLISIENSEPTADMDGFRSLIQRMLKRVSKLADRSKEVKLTTCVPNKAVTSTEVDPRIKAFYEDRTRLVAIDGPRDDLVRRLTGKGDEASSSRQIKIISIFGEGGLGKTTLAKEVFGSLAAKFHLRAFVSVGRSPDIKRVLKDILVELGKNTYANCLNGLIKQNAYANEDWNETRLLDELQNVLGNKRYLIVMDDIWDTESWDIIRCAFIDNGNGSRVITTSRIFEVANKSGEVCKLEPLSYQYSKELFYARLTSKGTHSSDQPDEQYGYILQKCGGVPLAIIAIASLLDGKPVDEWPELYNRIGFSNQDTIAKGIKKILLFSYNDLPCHLKTCLLYLSIFPEDHVIDKNMLVWKWIAEGFVHEEQGEILFKVGERYFYDLINRSIIQPVQHPAFFTISGCRVHDMVRDLICSIAKEECFVTILDSDRQHLSSQNDARILAVQNRVLKQNDLGNRFKDKVRSFNATISDLSQMELDSLLPSFKVLHVLSLKDSKIYGAGDRDARGLDRLFMFGFVCCSGGLNVGLRASSLASLHGDHHCCLQNLVGLHHLRYLGLSGTDINMLPEKMGDLFRSLLILDLRDTQIMELPESVTLLRKLKCLLCEIIVKLPLGMGSLTSLEELQLHLVVEGEFMDEDSSDMDMDSHDLNLAIENFVQELGKLKELRVLHIRLKNEFSPILTKALVESLNKLTKLEEVEVYDPTGGWDHPNSWGGYLPSKPLRHVRLCNSEPPAWINARLQNVTYLHLEVSSLKVGDINKLECLAELRSLFLFIPFDFGINFHDDHISAAFPKLRYFKTNCWLKYLRGAMRCLEYLELVVQVQANVSFDFDSLQHLPLLQKVTAVIENGRAKREKSDAAKAAVRHALDIHPNRPILDLQETGRCTDNERNQAYYEDDGTEHIGGEQTGDENNLGYNDDDDSMEDNDAEQTDDNENNLGYDDDDGMEDNGVEQTGDDVNNLCSFDNDGAEDGDQTNDELRFWAGCCDGIYRK